MAKANELGGTLGRKRSLRAVLGAPFEMNQRSAQTAWARRMPPRQAQRSSTSGPVGSSASAASPSPTRHTRHTRSASAPGASAGGAASTATVTSDGARRTICSAASVGATFARARGCAAALLAATSAATSTAHTSLASGALRPAAPPPSPGGMRAAEQASGRGVWHLTADPCARHPRAGPARGAPAARRRREQTQAPHTRNGTGAVRFAGQVLPSDHAARHATDAVGGRACKAQYTRGVRITRVAAQPIPFPSSPRGRAWSCTCPPGGSEHAAFCSLLGGRAAVEVQVQVVVQLIRILKEHKRKA
jgi:hypothetical protein